MNKKILLLALICSLLPVGASAWWSPYWGTPYYPPYSAYPVYPPVGPYGYGYSPAADVVGAVATGIGAAVDHHREHKYYRTYKPSYKYRDKK